MERWFTLNGRIYTALLAGGLGAWWVRPGSAPALALLHAGLLLLMVTPVSRVAVACVRYLRAGDRGSAALTLVILAVIAVSAWFGAS